MSSPTQESPYYLTTPQDPTNQMNSLVCIPWVSQDTGLAENEPNCRVKVYTDKLWWRVHRLKHLSRLVWDHVHCHWSLHC